ncbi:uncharacterized protein STEHIDRAFT_165547 [Stereum hirsutum FP-91666 SS1]|uniref:uncharacterized protein n=1 Tax=Stereum hirsutum (strain FP-91666) TaxID=721885 RepID=UPI000440FFC9|nr:uncharacterized protein STEHIDRAFT_165547 [Stereum hirsutum FP-91666 SS1]EIM91176.1 hypothetical protein STEHIDRAFT_165547 [Stereum hirsutum FP-91666 SS1]
MPLFPSTRSKAARGSHSFIFDPTWTCELQWQGIRNLFQTVECGSRSLEKLGLQAVDDLLNDINHISALLQSLERVVKTRRNAITAVSRLPNETLSMIFSTLDIYDLLSATAVCGRWRDVALQDATLWRNHICSLPGLTKEMIRRSGETPIGLHWNAYVYPSIRRRISQFPPILAESLDLALAQSHRVSHIELVEVGEHIVDAFSRATTSAPILQSMKLGDIYPYRRPYALIPPSTFAGQAPNLRHLVLDHIACPQGLLHNVTRLSASRGALGRSCAQILDTLSVMPMLEELEITNKTLERSTEVIERERIVTLPSLRRLALSGNQFFCLWLPQNLSVPSTSSFALECTETLHRCPRDPLILPHSNSTSSGTDPIATALARLHVRLECTSMVVEGWKLSAAQSSSVDVQPEPDISLSFHIHSVNEYDPMLSLLFKALRLQQVRTLRLSVGKSLDVTSLPRSMTDLLAKMPSLESCVAEGVFIGPFAKALNDCVGDGVGVFLTGLDELELIGHDFARDTEARVAENLLAYAAARDRMGGRMRVIRLRDCEDTDAMWLEELGRVVGEVNCCRTPSTSYC